MLECEGVPINGSSQLNFGDMEFRLENDVAIKTSPKHEYEYLVTDNEEPRTTSPSPLDI